MIGLRAATGVRVGLLLAGFALPALLIAGAPPSASAATTSTTTPAAPLPLSTVVLSGLGPGYAVTSEGPLDAGSFASSSPNPSAASGALASLGSTIATYQRTWAAENGANEVQDLVVQFPSAASAQIFLSAMRHSLESGEVVSSGPLPSVPGARRTTYFAATSTQGVGQAITMEAGVYVSLLSFFSASANNPQPITPADAAVIAKAQHAALVAAPGGTAGATATDRHAQWDWAVLAVLVLGVAVATPIVLRRRAPRAGTRASVTR